MEKAIKGNYISFSLKKFTIIISCILAFIYYIDSNKINFTKNKIFKRILSGKDDPRLDKPNENCMQIDDNSLFDLFPLENVDVNITGYDKEIIFQFCKNIEGEDSSCIYKKDNSEPIRLSGDIDGESDNKNKVKVENPDDESKRSVTLFLAAGDRFNNTNERYKITIFLKCNNSVAFNMINDDGFDPERTNDLYFIAESKYACGDHDAYGEFGKAGRIIAGIIFIISGFLVGILGYKIRKVGILIICCSLSLILSIIIISLCDITKTAIEIVIIVIFLIGGIALSILFVKKGDDLLRYYMIIIGGVCGYPLGELIYNLFFAIIDTSKQEMIRIIIIVSFIVVGVVLGFIWPKYTCIAGTSIIGAYAIMRSLGFFLYGKVDYIQEQKLYDLAHSGNYEMIADMIWGEYLMYPGILIAFIIIFIIVQMKITPDWLEAGYKGLDKFTGDSPELQEDFKLNSYADTREDE